MNNRMITPIVYIIVNSILLALGIYIKINDKSTRGKKYGNFIIGIGIVDIILSLVYILGVSLSNV